MADVVWKKSGKDFQLVRAMFEGGFSPLQAGGWHWWVRTPTGRYSGQASSEMGAQSSIEQVIAWTETGQDPVFYLDPK